MGGKEHDVTHLPPQSLLSDHLESYASPDKVSCHLRPCHLPSKLCEHAAPSAWNASLVLSSHLSWSLQDILQILT